MNLRHFVSSAAWAIGLVGAGDLESVEVVGVGTEFLLGVDPASDDYGEDLTDLENDGDEFAYLGEGELAGFDAIFFSSDEPGFEGGEFAFNVFDNILAPTNGKWCCGTQFPQIVGAQIVTDGDDLDTEYILTHFTVSSANDVADRDPVRWRIEGCSGCDIENLQADEWEVIFSEEDLEVATEELGLDPFGPIWTERFQVIRFDAGEDYDEPPAYSQFRMVTEETRLIGGAFFQVGEIEFFGTENIQCAGLEAVIQATPAQGEQPLVVSFDGSQSKTNLETCGMINRYEWKIDGVEAAGAQVSRTFERFGTKPVELRVKTDRGLGSSTAKSSIAVGFRDGSVAPWTSTRLGEATVSGGARMEAGCVVIGAGGKGVLSQRDQDAFQFVHLKLTGDFSVSARIRSVSRGPRSLGLGGIMARASADLDSPFAMVGIRQRGGVLQPLTRRRTAAGRLPVGRNPTDEVDPPAFYVRLDRKGDEFSFFSSSDGTSWEDLEGRTREIDLPDEVLVGLLASAEDASERAGREDTVEVTFCELTGFPVVASSGFRRGDADDNGLVQLADAIFILNHLFAGGPAYTCADAADADNDGAVGQTDAIVVLRHLFGGGAAPPAPGIETCGPDPDPDDGNGCEAYTSC